MYENNPKSKCNIVTIRFREGHITVGSYKNYDENKVNCITRQDINAELISWITKIYNEKVKKFKREYL